MIGQIESYISILDINSSDELINRIETQISNLPDDDNKTRVLSLFLVKKSEINREKEFKAKQNAVEKIEIMPERVEDQKRVYIDKKRQEEIDNNNEIEKKVREYLSQKINNQPKTEKNKSILISAYNLIRLSKTRVVLLRENNTIKSLNSITKPSMKKDGIPSLPIFEEVKETEHIYGIMPIGVYIGSNNIRWIISELFFKKEDEFGKIICQYKYKIDNYVMSLIESNGNINLLTFKDMEHGNYDVYDNNKLVDSISYMGKMI